MLLAVSIPWFNANHRLEQSITEENIYNLFSFWNDYPWPYSLQYFQSPHVGSKHREMEMQNISSFKFVPNLTMTIEMDESKYDQT